MEVVEGVVVELVVVELVVLVVVRLEQHKVLGEIRADYVLLYHRTLVAT